MEVGGGGFSGESQALQRWVYGSRRDINASGLSFVPRWGKGWSQPLGTHRLPTTYLRVPQDPEGRPTSKTGICKKGV